MKAAFGLLWLALTAMWLVLNETLTLAQWLIGALVALAGLLGFAKLEPVAIRLRRPRTAAALAALVVLDVVRSNADVARIVLRRNARGRTAGFVEVPLDLRHPAALAVLACIITSTPGTAWAGYDSHSNVLTMHVLDLVDEATWVRTIKERYERRLMEIFE